MSTRSSATLAKGLAGALRTNHYGLFIASSEGDPELEKQDIEQMLARRVDAIVIATSQSTLESFQQVEARRIPYVLVDRTVPDLTANFVGIDDEAAGAMATEHLLEQGCRRIAHIRGPEVSTSLGRLEGYRSALERHGISYDPQYVDLEEAPYEGQVGTMRGFEPMKRLLALPSPPDGVFCYNDPTAMGALRAIFEAGLRVPDDIAVIGSGNFGYADLLQVPLSSIDQKSSTMGAKVGELTLALMASKEPLPARTVLMEPTVVARASTLRGQRG